jgi:hypothetical protein
MFASSTTQARVNFMDNDELEKQIGRVWNKYQIALFQELIDAEWRWSKLRQAWTSCVVSAHIQAAHP